MEKLVSKKMFKNIYAGKNVFITGHTGFKGSWLNLWLNYMGANVTGFALKPHTNPNHFDLLKLNTNSIIADIRNYEYLEKKIIESKPEIVFHLAAQPYVIDSFQNPKYTYETNVLGTLNIIEAVRKSKHTKALVLITTDKVYKNTEKQEGYIESDRLGGYDPYSSSKACCELLINSYRNSFFNVAEYDKSHSTLMASARAGNVIGGGDWGQNRLIPDIIKSTIQKQETEIRNPNAVRPWQHVLESLSGYLLLGQNLLEGNKSFSGAWNFGPAKQNEIPVYKVAEILKSNWEKVKFKHADADAEKYHETTLLKLDSTKALSELNWEPIWNAELALEKSCEWYKAFYDNNDTISTKQLDDYINSAIGKKLIWTL